MTEPPDGFPGALDYSANTNFTVPGPIYEGDETSDDQLDDLVHKVLSGGSTGKSSNADSSSGKHEASSDATSPTSPGSSGGKVGFWASLLGDDSSKRDAYEVPQFGVRVTLTQKPKRELDHLMFAQCLPGAHKGPIWRLAFSAEGLFLASAGQDGRVVIWRTLQAVKEDFEQSEFQTRCESNQTVPSGPKLFASDPWRVLTGHQDAVVDLAWSNSQFLLSASEDCSVRLWHAQRASCLRVFQHPLPVLSVRFAPNNDATFVTGCRDTTVRVWSAPEGRVVHWLCMPQPVTSLCFLSDQEMVIAGLEDGEVRFIKFNPKVGLEFFTQIECRNRRGVQRKGKRVTGIEACTLIGADGKPRDVIVVTTNDSRIRLCSLDTYLCLCKYKGATNNNFPIAGTVSETGGHLLCGSEDRNVYMWKLDFFEQETSGLTSLAQSKKLLGHVVKKCSSHESWNAHAGTVTAAIFAPRRTRDVAREAYPVSNSPDNVTRGAFTITAGVDGHIHIFEN